MTSHVDNIRQMLAHSLGISGNEVRLIESNSTGIPGRWLRVRARTPIIAHVEAVMQKDASGRPLPGTLEWPISDIAWRDQPDIDAGAYAVPTSLPESALRRAGFVPIATIDDSGTFTAGWIDARYLVWSGPPPYLEAYIASRASDVARSPTPAPSGISLSPDAFKPQSPFQPQPQRFPAGPNQPFPGFQPSFFQPRPMAPPIAVELPPPPPVEASGGLSTGWALALVGAGVTAVALVAAAAGKGKGGSGDKKGNRKRYRRNPGDGWHWVRQNAAVRYKGGHPVEMQGWGDVDSAVKAAEKFSGLRLHAGPVKPGPKTLSNRRGWSITVRAS